MALTVRKAPQILSPNGGEVCKIDPFRRSFLAGAPTSRFVLFDFEVARGLFAPIRNDFVLDLLIFVERAKPGALNRGNMYKNVRSAARRSDETVALCWIEPFHGTASQYRLHSRKVENAPTNTNTFFGSISRKYTSQVGLRTGRFTVLGVIP